MLHEYQRTTGAERRAQSCETLSDRSWLRSLREGQWPQANGLHAGAAGCSRRSARRRDRWSGSVRALNARDLHSLSIRSVLKSIQALPGKSDLSAVFECVQCTLQPAFTEADSLSEHQ